MLGTISRVDLDRVRSQLRRNAPLFEQPDAYVAGVEDTIDAIIALADGRPPQTVVRLPDSDASRII